jgi:hypothetical protein
LYDVPNTFNVAVGIATYPFFVSGSNIYLQLPGGFTSSIQGGYARLCVYVIERDASQPIFSVYSNLQSAWSTGDLSAPEPTYQYNSLAGLSDSIGALYQYTCAKLDWSNSFQSTFYTMSGAEQSNGFMINYPTTSTRFQFDIFNPNQPYIEYVSCKFELILIVI